MKRLTISQNDLKQLIADAVLSLGTSKTVTLKMEDLLKLPTPKEEDKPHIHVTEVALKKMQSLVSVSDQEVAWHGVVSRLGVLDFEIQDILVYPQEVSYTTVDSDDEMYPQWLEELDDDTFNSIRMQGHSHVNMGVTPSGTDTDYYDKLIKHINDYYIFIILNKSGKIWVNLYDLERQLVYETKDINMTYAGTNYNVWAEENLEKYIQKKTYHYRHRTGGSKITTVGKSIDMQTYLEHLRAKGGSGYADY